MFAMLVILSLCFILNAMAKDLPLQYQEKRVAKYRGSDCLFGEENKEIGSWWNPDLGPPFGVRYCIKCECVPVKITETPSIRGRARASQRSRKTPKRPRKQRIIGKVNCRNIELECPEPTCENPVTLPQTCCKICPNDPENVPDVLSTAPEGEEDVVDYFAALLSGQSSQIFNQGEPLRGVKSKQDNVATGRFFLQSHSLRYSFYSTSRPQRIQFTDLVGNILEEKLISENSEYQNLTGKVCGVWRRLSQEYRKMLNEEKIFISLIWEETSDTLIGQLIRNPALGSELFSSLLKGEPEANGGAGGTAIISLDPNSESLQFSLLFNGIFTPQDVANTGVIVRIEDPQSHVFIVNEVLLVKKPSNELNVIKFSKTLPAIYLSSLTGLRLTLSVQSKHSSVQLSGQIMARVTCEGFQAAMTSKTTHNSKYFNSSTPSSISGLSWTFIDQINQLHYKIQIEGTEKIARVTYVTIENATPVLEVNPLIINGWINGTVARLSPHVLNLLYNGKLEMNIASSDDPSVVRGKLVSRFMTEMRDVRGPVLLSETNSSISNLSGLFWAVVDSKCSLLYEVFLVGDIASNMSFQLFLEDIPFIAPGTPVKSKLLQEFNGFHIEGANNGLTDEELNRLSVHLVTFVVRNAKSGVNLLKGHQIQLSIPASCLSHSGNTLSLLNYGSDDSRVNDIEGSICYHGDKFHEEGTQWKSTTEPCKMCHCLKSRVQCVPFICPPVKCQYPVIRDGECCPICLRETLKNAGRGVTSGKCNLGGETYLPGASWYPYLLPYGFDTCAICSCSALTLEVKCPRLKCPPLNCDEKMAIRPSKTACCKVCPLSVPNTETPELIAMLHDEAQTEQNKEEEIIAAGGCRYPIGKLYRNGDEWHPQVLSHGEMKCILCKCKDGKVKCARKKCSRVSCDDQCCSNICQKRRK